MFFLGDLLSSYMLSFRYMPEGQLSPLLCQTGILNLTSLNWTPDLPPMTCFSHSFPPHKKWQLYPSGHPVISAPLSNLSANPDSSIFKTHADLAIRFLQFPLFIGSPFIHRFSLEYCSESPSIPGPQQSALDTAARGVLLKGNQSMSLSHFPHPGASHFTLE